MDSLFFLLFLFPFCKWGTHEKKKKKGKRRGRKKKEGERAGGLKKWEVVVFEALARAQCLSTNSKWSSCLQASSPVLVQPLVFEKGQRVYPL
jgi:hypothetical protein